MAPWRLLPLSSGGLVHVRAQCPTLPQRAHLVRLMSDVLLHILGRPVVKERPPLGGCRSVIAFMGGLAEYFPFDSGALLLKKPRFKVFLCRYCRTCP